MKTTHVVKLRTYAPRDLVVWRPSKRKGGLGKFVEERRTAPADEKVKKFTNDDGTDFGQSFITFDGAAVIYRLAGLAKRFLPDGTIQLESLYERVR